MFRKQKNTARNVQTTGRAGAPVFSYHSSRSGGESQRARFEPPVTHKRGFERLKHLPTALSVVVIVGCLFYASLLDSRPRVSVVASTTGKPLQRPTKVYEAYITQQMERSFTNRSKLTFNSQPITASLQKQFPEVANAVITIPLLGHRPVISIAVSSPAFILGTSSGAYYISADGMPLVKVTDVENPLANIRTVTDETNLPIRVGTQVLPTKTVSFIADVIKQLEATNTPIQSVTLPLEANELQIRIVGKPYVIRYNTIGDARAQTGTFLAVKKRLEGSGELPKEYIDVRVEERAYYK